MSDIAENLARIRERVVTAAARAGRDPGSVCIIAVSKTKPAPMLRAAIAAGATDLGENYVQEAASKIPQIAGAVRWHMIGHLQRNKAARAVELFDVIHSVDSLAVGQALAHHGEIRQRVVRAFIEVNVGGEATKRGVAPAMLEPLLAGLGNQQWLSVDGLMIIPPPSPSAEQARPYFRAVGALRDALRRQAPANAPLAHLSMGMSDDFEIAIEEGATMVRIGRAIFGEREG